MNNKQKILNEIKNGEKKDYYQACIKKDMIFDIVVDNVKYQITASGDEPLPTCANAYANFGATAWRIPESIPGICKEKHELTSEELEFVWAEEWAEKRAKWIDHLISLIPANITEAQRKYEVMWIKSGKLDDYTVEDKIKSIQPWTAKELADIEELENFIASL